MVLFDSPDDLRLGLPDWAIALQRLLSVASMVKTGHTSLRAVVCFGPLPVYLPSGNTLVSTFLY